MQYGMNVMGMKGPRKMTVGLPKVMSNGHPHVFQSFDKDGPTIVER